LVWDNIKNYDSKDPFALWIKNLTISYSINELCRSEVPKSKPKEPSECNSESEYLELLIKSLPVDDRIIFVLHDLEGYSYQEINNFFNKYEIDEIKTKLINTRDYLMSKIDL
jgi:DNA-directed RNA polymerase specialized sigma24 family protein